MNNAAITNGTATLSIQHFDESHDLVTFHHMNGLTKVLTKSEAGRFLANHLARGFRRA